MKRGKVKRALRDLRDEVAALGVLVMDCQRRVRRVERFAVLSAAPPHLHTLGVECPICSEAIALIRDLSTEVVS